MNKLAPLVLALVVILNLALGCASEEASTPRPAQTSPSTTEPAPTPASVPSPEPTSPPASPTTQLKVHFIDVGQGDAILIDLQDIEVLIDGGDRSPGVVPYLKSHVDGPLEVLEIWHNGDTATSKTYSDFMSAVKAENVQVFQAVRGNTIEADGLVFKVLHPENLRGTTNNNSIVLHLAFGEIDYLFTGDAEREAEASMLNAGLVPDVEILKVGHHGSRTASSQAFLTKIQPKFAIYMAGMGNKYGHPHQETLDALAQIGAKIYGTDVNGSIVVTTDGTAFSIKTER